MRTASVSSLFSLFIFYHPGVIRVINIRRRISSAFFYIDMYVFKEVSSALALLYTDVYVCKAGCAHGPPAHRHSVYWSSAHQHSVHRLSVHRYCTSAISTPTQCTSAISTPTQCTCAEVLGTDNGIRKRQSAEVLGTGNGIRKRQSAEVLGKNEHHARALIAC